MIGLEGLEVKGAHNLKIQRLSTSGTGGVFQIGGEKGIYVLRCPAQNVGHDLLFGPFELQIPTPPDQLSQINIPACPCICLQKGNGLRNYLAMASKEENPKAQRESPKAEQASPKKRRKVNHGRYDHGEPFMNIETIG